MVKLEIVTVHEWGARRPRSPVEVIGAASRIIFHHTAGHHRELSNPRNESRAETMRYAQDVQAFHMMGNGWIDSGHHFLVCRNGDVLQGRWLTISAIQAGHMVTGAHCPGQNHNIGIEHEHKGSERMTSAQFESSARLQAWIAAQYHRAQPLPVDPHRAHFATSCPANLADEIPAIRARAREILGGAR